MFSEDDAGGGAPKGNPTTEQDQGLTLTNITKGRKKRLWDRWIIRESYKQIGCEKGRTRWRRGGPGDVEIYRSMTD